MSDQLIVLCPGQGAQHVGMGKEWYDHSNVAKETFHAADEQLGVKLSEICFSGPEDKVNGTDIAQAAIYVSSIACIRALADEGTVNTDNIVATAGLSLGEYTALHLAGVFSFEDGLKLVWNRGHFMQDAAVATPSSMVAIIGADAKQVHELCERARGEGILVPANYNCPGQIVISGTTDACERSLKVAEEMEIRATALTVAGAFHSPVVQPAADKMTAVLDDVEFNAPRVPVMSNVTGEPHTDDTSAIKQRLVEQITSPVKWDTNVQWLLDNVEGQYIETAPGKVLSGLMRRIDRKTKVKNHATP